ncbi:hypothetical protein IE53DRAFT_61607 [Violaceomyces palustris]|uniref:Uncharacterized protein n=1 Tax=Violaceomyces palustris TaxID=1673888 RepID=A0ACD0NZD7_9BASI|nr:hypothetical protein IE53DRAFT_61607 [Violaceomyces palustris]
MPWDGSGNSFVPRPLSRRKHNLSRRIHSMSTSRWDRRAVSPLGPTKLASFLLTFSLVFLPHTAPFPLLPHLFFSGLFFPFPSIPSKLKCKGGVGVREALPPRIPFAPLPAPYPLLLCKIKKFNKVKKKKYKYEREGKEMRDPRRANLKCFG